MIEYGEDFTCQHGEPWGDCPQGCKQPNNPPEIDWYDLEVTGPPPDHQHPWTRPDTPPTPTTNGHAQITPERELHRDRFRALLLDTKGLDNIPEPHPLISGVLQRNTLAWLAGKPGSAKTLIALDMAGCVATGEPWQGYRTDQAPVLYVIAEGATGIRPRVRAWEAAMSLDMTGVHFLPLAVHATKQDEWNAFCDLAAEITPGLIVLDTQARITSGLDENAARDMGPFVDQLERLRRASKACILTIHHTPRDSDHLRGHTTLEGAADTIIMCVIDGDHITVFNDPAKGGKQKDMEPFDPVHLRLTQHDTSVVVTPTDPHRAVDLTSGTIREMLRSWWQCHGSDYVSASILIKSGVASERTFYRNVKALVNQDIVAKTGKGSMVRYSLRRAPDED